MQAFARLEALYDHATTRVANCIEEVVDLVVAELEPVVTGVAPHPADIPESAEDAEFVAAERRLKLDEGIVALRAVANAKGRDELHNALQALIKFASDPKTLFMLEYDDIKHPRCCIADAEDGGDAKKKCLVMEWVEETITVE